MNMMGGQGPQVAKQLLDLLSNPKALKTDLANLQEAAERAVKAKAEADAAMAAAVKFRQELDERESALAVRNLKLREWENRLTAMADAYDQRVREIDKGLADKAAAADDRQKEIKEQTAAIKTAQEAMKRQAQEFELSATKREKAVAIREADCTKREAAVKKAEEDVAFKITRLRELSS